jgi:site-specific recombinase XerD
MLHRNTSEFLDYCQLADFSIRSVQALAARLNEFKKFLKTQRIRSVKRILYRHLIDFAGEYKTPSIHVTKSRVWTLGQFYHFLILHGIVPENIATGLPFQTNRKDGAPVLYLARLSVFDLPFCRFHRLTSAPEKPYHQEGPQTDKLFKMSLTAV